MELFGVGRFRLSAKHFLQHYSDGFAAVCCCPVLNPVILLSSHPRLPATCMWPTELRDMSSTCWLLWLLLVFTRHVFTVGVFSGWFSDLLAVCYPRSPEPLVQADMGCLLVVASIGVFPGWCCDLLAADIALLPLSDIDCLFVVLKAVGVFTPGG